MKYPALLIIAFISILIFPCQAGAQGFGFDDEEEEYQFDREELIEIILELAGEEAEIFSGRWLKIPVARMDNSEAAARMARVMETRRISVSFQDTKLSDVVTFIADITGLNIVLSPELAGSDETVTLRLKDIKVVHVINLICDCIDNASWTFKNEVLYIGTEEEVKDAVVKDFVLIDLAEFLIAPPDFKGPDIRVFNPEE
ncbi:MAG: hypothetical protein ACYS8W_19575 [Planctomycetota bacterium]